MTNNVVTIAANTVGQIRYTDANDLSIGNVGYEAEAASIGISAPGQLVSLTSAAGGITDNNGGAMNVTSGSLALRAINGIGSGDALETAVSTLAALNTTAGNIRIHNDLGGGALAIGTTDPATPLVGVKNTAPLGGIEITNTGAMNINDTIDATEGGNIVLTTTAGHLTINRHVWAHGGSGDITFTTAGNLILHDTGDTFDVEVQGNGFIRATAGGTVLTNNDSSTIFKSANGTAAHVPILIQNVQTPDVTQLGEATLILDVGVFSETNFTITIDWHDGTVETFTLPTGGTTYTFTHFYDPGNLPDPSNPAAPIPITFNVVFEDHILLFGNSGADNLNDEEQTPFAAVPGEGIGGRFFILDTSSEGLNLTRPASNQTVLTTRTATITFTLNNAFRAGDTDQSTVGAIRIVLRVLNPDGTFKDYLFPPEKTLDDVLKDLPNIFANLIDGHYQILIRDGDVDRVVFDVQVVQHKPTDPSVVSDEGSQEKPPTPTNEGDQENVEEQDESQTEDTDLSLPIREDLLNQGTNNSANAASATVNLGIQLDLDGDGVPPNGDESSLDNLTLPVAAGGAVIGGAAAMAAAESWEDRIDEAMRKFRKKSLGKAARLFKKIIR